MVVSWKSARASGTLCLYYQGEELDKKAWELFSSFLLTLCPCHRYYTDLPSRYNLEDSVIGCYLDCEKIQEKQTFLHLINYFDVLNKINGIKNRYVRLLWLAQCSKNNFDSEGKRSLSEVKALKLEE